MIDRIENPERRIFGTEMEYMVENNTGGLSYWELNGGLTYPDGYGLECATPETAGIAEATTYTHVSDLLIAKSTNSQRIHRRIHGHSEGGEPTIRGFHINLEVAATTSRTKIAEQLGTFITACMIINGAGWADRTGLLLEDTVMFGTGQRGSAITDVIKKSAHQAHKPWIIDRNENHNGDSENTFRLQITADPNINPHATAATLGLFSIGLRLCENGIYPKYFYQEVIPAAKKISHSRFGNVALQTNNGMLYPTDVIEDLLNQAMKHQDLLADDEREMLPELIDQVQRYRRDPMLLWREIDHVTKTYIAEQKGLTKPMDLAALDLNYDCLRGMNTETGQGVGYRLHEEGHFASQLSKDDLEKASQSPPNTRALYRTWLHLLLKSLKVEHCVEWSQITTTQPISKTLTLSNARGIITPEEQNTIINLIIDDITKLDSTVTKNCSFPEQISLCES